jgi:lantibiotic modifying enzyme
MPEAEFVNSTEMKPVGRSVQPYPTKNEVLYRGSVQNAMDFIQKIESGFAGLHGFLVEKKESLLNFLSLWSEGKSRLIFRPIQLYAVLLLSAKSFPWSRRHRVHVNTQHESSGSALHFDI